MGMPATRMWTRDEVLALPDDGQRYELVDGELLVSPSPRRTHQRAVRDLFLLLHHYVEFSKIGEVLFSPSDLDLRTGQLVQPDLFVVAQQSIEASMEWEHVGVPALVVEVLSPSTAGYDRIKKRRLYQRVGVPTYWIVDLDARLVEVWTPDSDRPVIVDGDLSWQPESQVEPLVIHLPEFFQKVWREG